VLGERDQAAAPRERPLNDRLLPRFIAMPRADVVICQSRPDLSLEKYTRLDERRTE
jgi:hypothetical protein